MKREGGEGLYYLLFFSYRNHFVILNLNIIIIVHNQKNQSVKNPSKRAEQFRRNQERAFRETNLACVKYTVLNKA